MVSTVNWQECERLQCVAKMLHEAPQNAREWHIFKEQYEMVLSWPHEIYLMNHWIYFMQSDFPVKEMEYTKRGIAQVLRYNSSAYLKEDRSYLYRPSIEMKKFDEMTGSELCKLLSKSI